MSHRFPLAPFAHSRALSRRGDLRLCRSIPIGSIPAGNGSLVLWVFDTHHRTQALRRESVRVVLFSRAADWL